MKTILAITVVFFGIVFFNCGDSLVNSGNYSPQVETGTKVVNVSMALSDSSNNGYGAFKAPKTKNQFASAEN